MRNRFIDQALREANLDFEFGDDPPPDNSMITVDNGPVPTGAATTADSVQIELQAQSQKAMASALGQTAQLSPTTDNVTRFQSAYNQHNPSAPVPISGKWDQPTTTAFASLTTGGISGEFGVDEPADMITARTLQAAPVKSAALVLAFQRAHNIATETDDSVPLTESGVLDSATAAALAQYDFSLAPGGAVGNVQSAANQLDQAAVKTPVLVTAFQMAYNASNPTQTPLWTDGKLGPLTAAALAGYIPADREQQYFNAFQSAKVAIITTEVPPPGGNDSVMAGEVGARDRFGYRRYDFGADATNGMDLKAAQVLLASTAKSPELIRAFQLAYNGNGGTPALTADGILGPLTSAALAKYTGTTLGTNTAPATAPNPPLGGPALPSNTASPSLHAAVPQTPQATTQWGLLAAGILAGGLLTWSASRVTTAVRASRGDASQEPEYAVPSEPAPTVKRRARA